MDEVDIDNKLKPRVNLTYDPDDYNSRIYRTSESKSNLNQDGVIKFDSCEYKGETKEIQINDPVTNKIRTELV